MPTNKPEINSVDEVASWIVESQLGNTRAFELLYREFYQRLFLFCRRMTGATEPAEELVQESFIKAWQALPKFRHESSFYTWLRQIASRLVIDRFRLKQEQIWQNAVELSEVDFSAKFNVEQKMDLDKLIAFLPEGARSVIVLHDIEGYRHKEIAAMMNIAEGTSKAQLSRARSLLRSAYLQSPDREQIPGKKHKS